MTCHFHICAYILRTRGQGVHHKVWATYLFQNLGDRFGGITGYKAANKDEIESCITDMGVVSYIVEFDEDRFKAVTVFRSFDYEAEFPVSSQGLITGFILL